MSRITTSGRTAVRCGNDRIETGEIRNLKSILTRAGQPLVPIPQTTSALPGRWVVLLGLALSAVVFH